MHMRYSTSSYFAGGFDLKLEYGEQNFKLCNHLIFLLFFEGGGGGGGVGRGDYLLYSTYSYGCRTFHVNNREAKLRITGWRILCNNASQQWNLYKH